MRWTNWRRLNDFVQEHPLDRAAWCRNETYRQNGPNADSVSSAVASRGRSFHGSPDWSRPTHLHPFVTRTLIFFRLTETPTFGRARKYRRRKVPAPCDGVPVYA